VIDDRAGPLVEKGREEPGSSSAIRPSRSPRVDVGEHRGRPPSRWRLADRTRRATAKRVSGGARRAACRGGGNSRAGAAASGRRRVGRQELIAEARWPLTASTTSGRADSRAGGEIDADRRGGTRLAAGRDDTSASSGELGLEPSPVNVRAGGTSGWSARIPAGHAASQPGRARSAGSGTRRRRDGTGSAQSGEAGSGPWRRTRGRGSRARGRGSSGRSAVAVGLDQVGSGVGRSANIGRPLARGQLETGIR